MTTVTTEGSDRQALHDISVKLTEETLLEVLQVFSKRKDVRVSGYKVHSLANQGDNFQANASRITLAGTSSSGDKYVMKLFVKGMMRNVCHRKTFRTAEFFANEVAFFEKVWPKLLAFQEKVKPKHPFNELPRCYKALSDGDNDFIILEDLGPAGYRTPSRLRGLDYTHCSLILSALARFHALSFAIKDKDPNTFREAANCIQEIYFKAELKSWYENAMQNFISVAMDAMSKEMPDSVYMEKLQQLTSGDLYSHIVELVANSKEPNGVICHGDTWTTNFLFQYPAGSSTPTDAKLIDFQLLRCSSPALDVSMVFYTCTLQDLRDKHYDALIEEYHATLSEFLSELGSNADKVYPLVTFRQELAKYSKYGLAMALELVPLSLFEDEETVNITMEGDQAVPLESVLIVHPIKHKEGRMRICNNIKHMVDHGYL